MGQPLGFSSAFVVGSVLRSPPLLGSSQSCSLLVFVGEVAEASLLWNLQIVFPHVVFMPGEKCCQMNFFLMWACQFAFRLPSRKNLSTPHLAVVLGVIFFLLALFNVTFNVTFPIGTTIQTLWCVTWLQSCCEGDLIYIVLHHVNSSREVVARDSSSSRAVSNQLTFQKVSSSH